MRPIQRRPRGFTLIELMIVVAIIGILAVLAIYGVSRYLKTSKTAEATNNIGAVQKNATEAMTREKGSGAYQAPGATISFSYGFCGNEANPVPKSVPAAQKYVSGAADWQVGKGTGVGGIDTGFYCLKFSVDQPQYYSYSYTVTGTGTTAGDSMTIVANGDLDGNGTTSDFRMIGKMDGTPIALVWANKPAETNPEE